MYMLRWLLNLTRAFQTYDSSKLLTEVQDELISLMVKDITEQIFNATVANW